MNRRNFLIGSTTLAATVVLGVSTAVANVYSGNGIMQVTGRNNWDKFGVTEPEHVDVFYDDWKYEDNYEYNREVSKAFMSMQLDVHMAGKRIRLIISDKTDYLKIPPSFRYAANEVVRVKYGLVTYEKARDFAKLEEVALPEAVFSETTLKRLVKYNYIEEYEL